MVSAASLQTLRQVRELAERLAGLAAPDNLARIERTLAQPGASSRGPGPHPGGAATLAAVRQVFSRTTSRGSAVPRQPRAPERRRGAAGPRGAHAAHRAADGERAHRHPGRGDRRGRRHQHPAAPQRAAAGLTIHLAAALRPARRDRQFAATAVAGPRPPPRAGRGGFRQPGH